MKALELATVERPKKSARGVKPRFLTHQSTVAPLSPRSRVQR
jgi:hypothetical protein